MWKGKKFLLGLCAAALCGVSSVVCAAPAPGNVEVKVVGDHIIDVGTNTNFVEKEAFQMLDSMFDGWKHPELLGEPQTKAAACTAAVKVLEDGTPLVGRNLDFFLSNTPSVIGRTNYEGFFRTIYLAHPAGAFPSFDKVKAEGIPAALVDIVPISAVDVLNEKGLYIECNMRNDQQNGDDRYEFSCSGTNPDSDIRVNMAALPQYLALRCSTVDEAVELAKTLDIYNFHNARMTWPFCFVLADAEGNYGVLEFAQNKMNFIKGESAQSNFYLTPEWSELQDYKCGIGRYEYVKGHLADVRNAHDMYRMMDVVAYSHIYDDPASWPFDRRTDFVDSGAGLSTAALLDPANQGTVSAMIAEEGAAFHSMNEVEKRNADKFWISIWTNVANCKDKTFTVRFNEDGVNVYKVAFDEAK